MIKEYQNSVEIQEPWDTFNQDLRRTLNRIKARQRRRRRALGRRPIIPTIFKMRRLHARAPRRRSPASARRATADSGGTDGDGGGDPEPPRSRYSSLSPHAAGGAL